MFTMTLNEERTRLFISATGLVKDDVPGDGYVAIASVGETVTLTRDDVTALVDAIDTGAQLERDKVRVINTNFGRGIRLGHSISIYEDRLSDNPLRPIELFRDRLGNALTRMEATR